MAFEQRVAHYLGAAGYHFKTEVDLRNDNKRAREGAGKARAAAAVAGSGAAAVVVSSTATPDVLFTAGKGVSLVATTISHGWTAKIILVACPTCNRNLCASKA